MENAYLEQLFGLNGRTAVVVGGTGVLGGAIAQGLARANAHVIVAGRDLSRGRSRVHEIEKVGGSAAFFNVDATCRESMKALLESVVAVRNNVDVLINCAGVNASTPYFEIPDDDWNKVLATNLTSTHLGCQIFGEHMAANGGGSIVNLGSVSAHLPLSKVFAYSASKAAVVNYTKNVARELAPKGVRVNVLCPGFFPAEQNRKILSPERTAVILSQTPMNRFGSPEELVGAVLLLVSPVAGSFVTGAEIYVDGGFTGMRL
ncbi:MAG: SDR family oxidoreductase [Planctomycetota bacterium]|jgi:NAD(P)-dependent dehydrogenase (short-subunit alcohol dehydrogenase family)|nr:MAG: SDR family oxidoreductase [Planctomycetota bacterium]RLS53767.1 MAG: SDR family oxidoreductase [Planctomycetota bacterium]RLS98951.1 MAG: SDR family oxidoreductase [Planctomycetota bacterium]